MGDNLNSGASKIKLKDKEYILDVALLLVLIQIGRIIIKYIFLSQLNFTYENVNIANIISFMLVGISIALFLRGSDMFNSAGQRLINLNNKYHNKNKRITLGVVTVLGIVISFYYESGYFMTALTLLTLSLIIEPIFEEILFREYLWNYIGNYEKDDKKILIIISILSALFKIGYWDIISQNLSVIGSSSYTIDIVLTKVFLGLIVSLLLGVIKIKFKDTYLCIFLHSIVNIFIGR